MRQIMIRAFQLFFLVEILPSCGLHFRRCSSLQLGYAMDFIIPQKKIVLGYIGIDGGADCSVSYVFRKANSFIDWRDVRFFLLPFIK